VNSAAIFAFAVIAAIADVIAILTWLKVEPSKIFSRDRWRREVTVTTGKVLLISALAVLSLTLSSYGFFTTYKQNPTVKILEWGTGEKRCHVVVDTSAITSMADDYNIVLACGIVDPTIDVMEDTKILFSGPFGIYGVPQSIATTVSTPDFDKNMEALGSHSPVQIWQKVFLLPKDKSVSDVHKLSDVARLKGKIF
jgi:hypothetical protein